MEAFVLKTLKRLRKESPRRFKDLRLICDELIVALSEKEKANGGESQETDADQYFEPLEMACQTRQPRLMEIALDAIHFLIEHGYLKGKKIIKETVAPEVAAEGASADGAEQPNPSVPKPQPSTATMMDIIVDTVSKCSDETDDGVQLQVIKALLTAITSEHCEVHEASLLLSVRACFHIHLISKNLINKTTAKAALTQIISVTNQRMEVNEQRGPAAESTAAASHVSATAAAIATAAEGNGKGPAPALSTIAEEQEGGKSLDSANDPSVVAAAAAALDKLGSGATAAAAAAAGAVASSSSSSSTTLQPGPAPTSSLVFRSVFHKDAYLLFRALCKLSMKGLNEDTQYSNNDAIPLQNKILSLELILHILNNTGPAFRSEEKFIYAVRTYLCVSLLSNCTSHVPQVAGLSLQIFLVLMQQFKDHLKHEVEVFVSNIFLRMLESENSTYDHKFRVLEVFQTICKDPQSLVELFMNYDCDLDAINLFSRIVNGLAKIAKNPSLISSASRGVDFMSSSTKKAQQEDHHIRSLGLECLDSIVQSLEIAAGLAVQASSAVEAVGAEGTGGATGEGLTPSSSDPSLASSLTSGALSPSTGAGKGREGSAEPVAPDSPVPVHEPVSGEKEITAEPSTPTGPGSNAAADVVSPTNNVVDVFDKKQKLSEELETGILKFNLSPKAGLAFLVQAGHIEMAPKSVADFFHQYQDRLDKTVMGEYLGREREYMDGFCLKVLNEYVDALDFAAMPFDLAIRYFLAGFRLPGEAQKIDRIMEKFAERYYLQNRDVFASADMAFILAFSTIMLQTNLHNPAIREDKRMTKEQFIKQNKGISADGELPDDLLMEIYDRIAAQPISINSETDKALKKKEEQPSFVMFQATSEKIKKDAYSQERKEMVRAGEAMIKMSARRSSAAFVRNSAQSNEAYARSMFEIVWPPVIGVLSQLLETYDDAVMVDLCLDGFRYSIRIACRLDFPTARNTFINALLKFTTLDAVKEMKVKNVSCIKLMTDLALSEGDYLEESWLQVLQSVSRLARLQLFASGSHMDDHFFSSDNTLERNDSGRYFRRGSGPGSTAVSDPFTKLFMGASRAETNRQMEEANAEMVVKVVDSVLVDRLFSHSVGLSAASVQHFVKYLCEVSMLELSTTSSMNSLRGKDSTVDSSAPRVFSLQKLVEVADANMATRARMEWANMWSLLAHHFSSAGLHRNQNVAMYAIDSLKQLSIKFLQKDELSNFNFQRMFLTPFETIMSKTVSQETKELVLNCIEVMIRSCAGNIHSGWRSIFTIFSVAATQDMPEIASNAFTIIQQLMTTQFHLLIFDFVELMNCLVCFVSSSHTNLAFRALDHLSTCADHLSAGLIDPAIHIQHASSDAMGISWEKSRKEGEPSMGEDGAVFRLWWPLLLGLSTSVADGRLKVRSKALDILHSVMCRHGQIFSPQTLAVIFKGVLFPIIDSAKTDNTQQPRSAWPTENPPPSNNMLSWIGTMGSKVLLMFIDLYRLFSEPGDSIALLPDVLSALESCIQQDTESLARLGVSTLSNLVLSLGVDAESEAVRGVEKRHADLVCDRIVADIIGSLCMDFGDAGVIYMGQEAVPEHVHTLLPRCPVTQRRNAKLGVTEGAKSTSVALATPYGVGHIVEEMDPTPPEHLGLPTRTRIKLLSWGAALYSTETYPEAKSPKSIGGEAGSGGSVTWPELATSAMTSMVVSIDFISLAQELLLAPAYRWDLQNYAKFLKALEASHWHAFCFNETGSLRLQLQQRGFMNKNRSDTTISPELPHLLDQEVSSLEQMLFTAFRLYCHNKHVRVTAGEANGASPSSLDGNESAVFAEPWVERLSTMVLTRYLSQEEVTLRKMGGGGASTGANGKNLSSAPPAGGTSGEAQEDDEDDDSSEEEDDEDDAYHMGANNILCMDEFLKRRHDAYKSPVLIVLEGMMDFTHDQFQCNLSWIIPLLSRLVICEDLEVRVCVRQIYQSFVNFLLIK